MVPTTILCVTGDWTQGLLSCRLRSSVIFYFWDKVIVRYPSWSRTCDPLTLSSRIGGITDRHTKCTVPSYAQVSLKSNGIRNSIVEHKVPLFWWKQREKVSYCMQMTNCLIVCNCLIAKLSYCMQMKIFHLCKLSLGLEYLLKMIKSAGEPLDDGMSTFSADINVKDVCKDFG